MACDRKNGNGQIIFTFGDACGLSRSEASDAYHQNRDRVGEELKAKGLKEKARVETNEAAAFFNRMRREVVETLQIQGATDQDLVDIRAAFDKRIDDIYSGKASLTLGEQATLEDMPGIFVATAVAKTKRGASPLKRESVPVGTERPLPARGAFAGFAKKAKKVGIILGGTGLLAGVLTGCSLGEEDRNNYIAACVDSVSQVVTMDSNCDPAYLPQEVNLEEGQTPPPQPGERDQPHGTYIPNAAWVWMYLNTRNVDVLNVGDRIPAGATTKAPKMALGDGMITLSSGRAVANNGSFGDVENGKVKGYGKTTAGKTGYSAKTMPATAKAPKFGGLGGSYKGGFGG